MGTSLTVLPSNIRLSLGISVSSRGAILARVFALPWAQPGKPTFGFVLQTNNDDGDVVHAPVLIGNGDQSFSCFLRVRFRLQSAGDLWIGDHAGQTIRTKKKQVARKERLLFGINFDLLLRTQRAKKNALHLALFGFAGAYDSTADLFGNERMIAG